MDIELAKLLVDLIRRSLRRCRWILSGVSIASLIVFATCWNVYFSWLRTLALQNYWGKPETVEYLQKKLLSSWVDSGFVTVPLLGIRVHIADGAVLGALGLSILMFWLFFSMRRLNHLVGKSLRMALDADYQVKQYLYYGVSSSHVFSTISENDDPIRSLTPLCKNQKFLACEAFLSLFIIYQRRALSLLFFVIC